MSTDNGKILADYEQSFNESLFKCTNFGEHMRILIKEKGWNTEEFCMWTTLDERTFSRIKRDDYMPTKSKFATICQAMELEMYAIMRLLQFTEINLLQKDDVLQKYFYILRISFSFSILLGD